MSDSTFKRVTFSLPASLVSDLDFVSSSLGVSRSAFVSASLSELVPPLIPLVKIVEKSTSEGDSRRYRGEFAEQLREMINNLNSGVEGLQDDLFKD